MRKGKRLLSPSRLALLTGGLLGLGGLGVGVSPAHANFTLDLKFTSIQNGTLGTPIPVSVLDVLATAPDQNFTLTLSGSVNTADCGIWTVAGDFKAATGGGYTGTLAVDGADVFVPSTGLYEKSAALAPYNDNGATPGLTNSVMRLEPAAVSPTALSMNVGQVKISGTGLTAGTATTVTFAPTPKVIDGVPSPTLLAQESLLWTDSKITKDGYDVNTTPAIFTNNAAGANAPRVLSNPDLVQTRDTAVSAVTPFGITNWSNANGKALYVVGPGTVNIGGTQVHGAGASLQAIGGITNINVNPGALPDGAGGDSSANLAINVPAPDAANSASVVLNGTLSGGTSDFINLKSISTDTFGAGVSNVTIGEGDPFAFGPGGTPFVQLFLGGTTAGSTLPRAAVEDTWFQVAAANAFGLNGITSSVVDPSSATNWLSMLQYDDSIFGGNGAPMVVLFKNIIGDLNGDFTVSDADLGILLSHIGTNPGEVPGEEAFAAYTWLEGDLNGDFTVTDADLGLLLGNLGGTYDPAAGKSVSVGAAVPEPSTLGLIGVCLAGLAVRRRRK